MPVVPIENKYINTAQIIDVIAGPEKYFDGESEAVVVRYHDPMEEDGVGRVYIWAADAWKEGRESWKAQDISTMKKFLAMLLVQTLDLINR